MNEKEEYYYPYLTGKYSLKFGNVIKFAKYVKSKFFNEKTNKWLPSEYKSFVRRNDLNYNECFSVLKKINVSDVVIKQKGFNQFLNKIEKYNSKDLYSDKIKIYEGFEIDFIKDLNKLREDKEYFKCSNKLFIQFIVDNFDINLSKSTIHKYFSEKKFE